MDPAVTLSIWASVSFFGAAAAGSVSSPSATAEARIAGIARGCWLVRASPLVQPAAPNGPSGRSRTATDGESLRPVREPRAETLHTIASFAPFSARVAQLCSQTERLCYKNLPFASSG